MMKIKSSLIKELDEEIDNMIEKGPSLDKVEFKKLIFSLK